MTLEQILGGILIGLLLFITVMYFIRREHAFFAYYEFEGMPVLARATIAYSASFILRKQDRDIIGAYLIAACADEQGFLNIPENGTAYMLDDYILARAISLCGMKGIKLQAALFQGVKNNDILPSDTYIKVQMQQLTPEEVEELKKPK